MNSLCYRTLGRWSKHCLPRSLSSLSLSFSTGNAQRLEENSSSSLPRDIPTAVPSSVKVGADEGFTLPRPREIPFQIKVANSVSIIGAVQSPVQFLASLDGKYLAGTVISQDHLSNSPISIPIIFEGDLAHTAVLYLKEGDNIYVAGHLSTDRLPLTLMGGQANFQIMVHSVNFVQGSPAKALQKLKDGQVPQQSACNSTSHQQMRNLKDVRKKFDSFWEDFLSDPTQWRDNRNDKLNHKLTPRYPDFKHKDGRGLWIDSAPQWVLPKLKALGINIQIQNTNAESQRSEDESWKDVIENPRKWWDNRSNKRGKTSADFKHKDTGERLWLDRAPDWVLAKLPATEFGNASTGATKNNMLS